MNRVLAARSVLLLAIKPLAPGSYPKEKCSSPSVCTESYWIIATTSAVLMRQALFNTLHLDTYKGATTEPRRGKQHARVHRVHHVRLAYHLLMDVTMASPHRDSHTRMDSLVLAEPKTRQDVTALKLGYRSGRHCPSRIRCRSRPTPQFVCRGSGPLKSRIRTRIRLWAPPPRANYDLPIVFGAKVLGHSNEISAVYSGDPFRNIF